MKRPAVEDFKRLTSLPATAWGMADSDVVELCDYILNLETCLSQQDGNYGRAKCEVAKLRAALEEIASGLSVTDPYEIANQALGRAVTE